MAEQRQAIIIAPTEDGIAEACAALRAGKLVGLPTETVYGLAAAIDRPQALDQIYAYKRRPYEDPLIVHVIGIEDALGLWQCDSKVKAMLECLASTFWPGPLTIIAKANEDVPLRVRGGGDSVGVRAPRHPVARRLLESVQVPLAAPSANLFGHVSPTIAQHVADDFADRELLILDGDQSALGIESTVIKVEDGKIQLLRHGYIQSAAIEACLAEHGFAVELIAKTPGTSPKKIQSPGQYLKHYAPLKPAWMLLPDRPSESVGRWLEVSLSRVACLDFGAKFTDAAGLFGYYEDLSPVANLDALSHVLFRRLRQMEQKDSVDAILLPFLNAKKPEEQALYDRIYRACEGRKAFIDPNQGLWVDKADLVQP